MLPNPERSADAVEVAKERRRHQRYRTPPLSVYPGEPSAETDPSHRVGYLLDVSLGGMRLAVTKAMAFGTPASLAIDLRAGPVAAGAPGAGWLRVQARATWVGPSDDHPGFEAGYEFIASSAMAVRQIEDLITALRED